MDYGDMDYGDMTPITLFFARSFSEGERNWYHAPAISIMVLQH